MNVRRNGCFGARHLTAHGAARRPIVEPSMAWDGARRPGRPGSAERGPEKKTNV
jgi:hypothetical protein